MIRSNFDVENGKRSKLEFDYWLRWWWGWGVGIGKEGILRKGRISLVFSLPVRIL